MVTADDNNYGAWVGRSKTDVDLITRTPLNALAATLDLDAPELVVPPLWHWVYFLSPTRMTDIGSDGHSKSHDFFLRIQPIGALKRPNRPPFELFQTDACGDCRNSTNPAPATK